MFVDFANGKHRTCSQLRLFVFIKRLECLYSASVTSPTDGSQPSPCVTPHEKPGGALKLRTKTVHLRIRPELPHHQMQLAALSCVLYVMQYFISIIHSYSGTDYRLQMLYWPGWNQAAGVLKIKI